MTDRTAPKIDPEKLDFSMWHPLDHYPLSKRCREHYGGFHNHMNLLWKYKWDVPATIKKITHCVWGKHHPGPWWKANAAKELIYAGQICRWCMKDLPEQE
jgi:hypothetical protein